MKGSPFLLRPVLTVLVAVFTAMFVFYIFLVIVVGTGLRWDHFGFDSILYFLVAGNSLFSAITFIIVTLKRTFRLSDQWRRFLLTSIWINILISGFGVYKFWIGILRVRGKFGQPPLIFFFLYGVLWILVLFALRNQRIGDSAAVEKPTG